MAHATENAAWSAFIEHVEDELRTSRCGFLDLDGVFGREQSLTQEIALGLRKLFIDFYGADTAAQIHHHVVYRQGVTPNDRKAWKAAKRDKWINLHGLNFVPDILIRPNLK